MSQGRSNRRFPPVRQTRDTEQVRRTPQWDATSRGAQLKTTDVGICLVIGLLVTVGCEGGRTTASDAVRTSTSQTTRQATGDGSPPADGEGAVVASGDVKGFEWDLIAYQDGDQTCYRLLHREAVAGWDCATPACA